MPNGAKFPGIPAGIFLKTYSREFPKGNSRWPCLKRLECWGHQVVKKFEGTFSHHPFQHDIHVSMTERRTDRISTAQHRDA